MKQLRYIKQTSNNCEYIILSLFSDKIRSLSLYNNMSNDTISNDEKSSSGLGKVCVKIKSKKQNLFFYFS